MSYSLHLSTDQADAYIWLPPEPSGAHSTVCHEHDVVCKDSKRPQENIGQVAMSGELEVVSICHHCHHPHFGAFLQLYCVESWIK